jgi:hypothetical protein
MTRNEMIETIALQIAAKENISVSRARAAVRRVARGRSTAELATWL